MKEYDSARIEKKWQERWEKEKTYKAVTGDPRPKYYALIEFPYPSGQGLHVGHARPYTAMDIVARKRRMQGYNVLFPIGYDAFGLPTENYAIKTHIHPAVVTKQNVDTFSRQLKMLGYSFDWDRRVVTSDPEYYKWTQWIFVQMFKNGLAYKANIPVNWCTSCKCVLANEEVKEGVCERCGSPVVRKQKSQWMLRITKYAQRLIDDLDTVNFIERAKTQEINWIGRSDGAEIDFQTSAGDIMTVYTTRPDTVFGVTYMVMSPEHQFLKKWAQAGLIENLEEVQAYQREAEKKSELERTELQKEKTGVRIQGVTVTNPVNNREVPLFISDYVLASYGTGAVMGVPAHDSRDWEFAKKFGLDIISTYGGDDAQEHVYDTKGITTKVVNSDFLNGMSMEEAIPAITKWLEEHNCGRAKVNYKLRDWVFSRQRYWGEPIPMIYCEKCGWVPVPEDQLPVLLPDVQSYELTDDGESPLAAIDSWVNTTCPKCGGPAKRETDTQPNWAGSNWYFLRYMDPHNDTALVGKDAVNYWQRVDWYNGGMEHTTLHLLYSRFCHKFLYDIGVVPTAEPYAKRTSHGMILGENGEKMSKSRGNVINPNDVVKEYGADTLRLYIMFIGDFEKAVPWKQDSVRGCRRFLERIWALACERSEGSDEYSPENLRTIHRTIKKVGDDIETMKFNTAIAALMTMVNQYYLHRPSRGDLRILLTLLSPFAPHIAEELWEIQGFEGMACQQSWPEFDPKYLIDEEVEIAVQINGKVRARVHVPKDSEEEAVREAALAVDKVAKQLETGTLRKTIYVPNRLVNLIVK
jgi:leucyl-tRNA synthetase